MIQSRRGVIEYAHVAVGQTVLIHGAVGNVGAYAVQLAKQAGIHVVATAGSADLDYVRGLGAGRVVDDKRERFEESLTGVDVVLDTVDRMSYEPNHREERSGKVGCLAVRSWLPSPYRRHP